jgi:hypothetical protein
MLAQLGDDRVGHDLTPVNLGRLTPIDRSMPTGLWIAMNGHAEIAGADPLLHDFFELGRGFRLLIHVSPENAGSVMSHMQNNPNGEDQSRDDTDAHPSVASLNAYLCDRD